MVAYQHFTFHALISSFSCTTIPSQRTNERTHSQFFQHLNNSALFNLSSHLYLSIPSTPQPISIRATVLLPSYKKANRHYIFRLFLIPFPFLLKNHNLSLRSSRWSDKNRRESKNGPSMTCLCRFAPHVVCTQCSSWRLILCGFLKMKKLLRNIAHVPVAASCVGYPVGEAVVLPR